MDGVEYSKRKVNLLRNNMEKLIEVISQKRKQVQQVRTFQSSLLQLHLSRFPNRDHIKPLNLRCWPSNHPSFSSS